MSTEKMSVIKIISHLDTVDRPWPVKDSLSSGHNINLSLLYHIAELCICFYTVSQKTSPMFFCYNLQKHCRIFIIFGRNITKKASNQMVLHFPPHLINASALPCETENTEIVSFHVNVSCWFANAFSSYS